MRKHSPRGPLGRWKTGQRVYMAGRYVDQYGAPYYFDLGTTFPPTRYGRKSVCGYYLAVPNHKRHSSVS